MDKKVLIIEDEKEIRELLRLYLEKENFKVVMAEEGDKGLKLFQAEQPDLVLLDILLPNKNGIEICKDIRLLSDVPVLFVSCKNESDDIISGLDLGADDYIPKPFDPGVVVARVKAILRRTQTTQISKLEYGPLEINLTNYKVLLNGEPVTLFAKELQLLILMARNPEQVYSVEQLYNQIWGSDSFGDTRTVMVHISNIRKKIEKDPSNPVYIQTVRGFGYKFNA